MNKKNKVKEERIKTNKCEGRKIKRGSKENIKP